MARTSKRYNRLEVELGNTDGLTKRQAEIALLMSKAFTNVEIANRLGISVDTVNSHIDALRDRFFATNRLDLLSQMWAHGFVEAKGPSTTCRFSIGRRSGQIDVAPFFSDDELAYLDVPTLWRRRTEPLSGRRNNDSEKRLVDYAAKLISHYRAQEKETWQQRCTTWMGRWWRLGRA